MRVPEVYTVFVVVICGLLSGALPVARCVFLVTDCINVQLAGDAHMCICVLTLCCVKCVCIVCCVRCYVQCCSVLRCPVCVVRV